MKAARDRAASTVFMLAIFGTWMGTNLTPTFRHKVDRNFRLSFHHTHNAIQLMNEKGAKRWVKLMVEGLDNSGIHMTDDARVRPSINTFLAHFFDKYATEFNFSNLETFGDTNPPVRRKINFMNMTSDAIETLPENDLKEALVGRGVDVSMYGDKADLVNKALSL